MDDVRKLSESQAVAVMETVALNMGYNELRPKQKESLLHFLQGHDVFVSLPTGSGKSLCFSLLPGIFDRVRSSSSSLVIVISPIQALMKDQAAIYNSKGLSAVANEQGSQDSVMCGQAQLLYMSPETLLTDKEWRDVLESPIVQENVVALVIDEAHCIKKWGEEFRREFSKIGSIRSVLPQHVGVMAFTATATISTRKVVCSKLGMVAPSIVSESPNKSNIKYIVKNRNDVSIAEVVSPIVEELKTRRTSMPRVIVFCRTYDMCGQVYRVFKKSLGKELTEPIEVPNELSRFRIVDMYTACTTKKVKNVIVKNFCDPNGVLRVVIATVAFGMGLDCPNVRNIVHIGAPSDVEEYIQETGRAGRDGENATATLYYSGTDFNFTTEDCMKEYCSSKSCRRSCLLKHFGDCSSTSLSSSCLCCDICAADCSCDECID